MLMPDVAETFECQPAHLAEQYWCYVHFQRPFRNSELHHAERADIHLPLSSDTARDCMKRPMHEAADSKVMWIKELLLEVLSGYGVGPSNELA